MNDNDIGEPRLEVVWRSLMERLAVSVGCFAALLSALHHAPVTTTVLRGGGAYLAALVIGRFGLAALRLTVALEASARAEGEDAES